MDRTFGIELEVGGVKTLQLAQFVYQQQRLDFATWKDRGRNTKNRDYAFWNVQSDPTIQNRDGSMCMYDVMIDGKLESIGRDTERKALQLGAEIISPVHHLSDYYAFERSLSTIVDYVKKESGYVSPQLDHEFHVHIGIDDYTLDDVKSLVQWSFNNMDTFFARYPGYADRFSKNRVYFADQVEQMMLCNDVSEFWELYKVSAANGRKSEIEFTYRKDVNPAHWLENKALGWDRPLTVEFRPIASSLDLSLLKTIIYDCAKVLDEIKVS